MGLINWFKENSKKIEKEYQQSVNDWKKRPIKFKTKFRCINCKNIFYLGFRAGEKISLAQDWRGCFAKLHSDCPKPKDGFIECPLCNMNECNVISTKTNIKQSKEPMEVQILP